MSTTVIFKVDTVKVSFLCENASDPDAPIAESSVQQLEAVLKNLPQYLHEHDVFVSDQVSRVREQTQKTLGEMVELDPSLEEGDDVIKVPDAPTIRSVEYFAELDFLEQLAVTPKTVIGRAIPAISILDINTDIHVRILDLDD